MKRYLALLVLMLGAVSGYGSQSRAGNPSQFSVAKATKVTRQKAEAKVTGLRKGPAIVHPAHGQVQTAGKASTKLAHANVQTSNSSPTTLGFVSATQIPAGGANYEQGYMGDFNGDGKKDVLSVIEQYLNNTDVFSISAVLGNGNGTFKAPVLTTVTSTDQLMIADLNGDGKDDIIQIHSENTPSTVDVWLSNGDGTFKQGNSYQVSPAELNGGMITDVNGDGKLDLVAVDAETPGLVRTLLGSIGGAIVAAIVLGIVNAVLRPILILLSLPIEILTLGLFTFIINAALFYLVASLHIGLVVHGFLAALIGSIVLSIVSWLLSLVFGRAETA